MKTTGTNLIHLFLKKFVLFIGILLTSFSLSAQENNMIKMMKQAQQIKEQIQAIEAEELDWGSTIPKDVEQPSDTENSGAENNSRQKSKEDELKEQYRALKKKIFEVSLKVTGKIMVDAANNKTQTTVLNTENFWNVKAENLYKLNTDFTIVDEDMNNPVFFFTLIYNDIPIAKYTNLSIKNGISYKDICFKKGFYTFKIEYAEYGKVLPIKPYSFTLD